MGLGKISSLPAEEGAQIQGLGGTPETCQLFVKIVYVFWNIAKKLVKPVISMVTSICIVRNKKKKLSSSAFEKSFCDERNQRSRWFITLLDFLRKRETWTYLILERDDVRVDVDVSYSKIIQEKISFFGEPLTVLAARK